MTTAGIWLRVSSDEQSEDNQLPDCEAWCRDHNYVVGPVFRVHGKSAWKAGRLDKDKAAVMQAFRTGQIDTLIVWSVDRWSRLGIADVVNGLKLIDDANGRIEFVKDNVLNAEGPLRELLLALLAWVASFESTRRSDRVKNGQERVRGEATEDDEIICGGDVPFGYRLVNNRKVRAEDELGMVREAYERSARGESVRTIGNWMISKGCKLNARTVAKLLRNDDYVADKVVTASVAKAARDGLDHRHTGAIRRTNADDYSAMVYCVCGKVMHRTFTGNAPNKTRYYRCTEHERVIMLNGKKSPLTMVRADDADVLIDRRMSSDPLPYMIPVRTGGDTRQADIAKLWVAIERATKRRDMAEVVRLQQELPVIQSREPQPERVEWIPSGKTRGDYWTELTIPERRAWLDSEYTCIVLWPSKHDEGVRKLWHVDGDTVPGSHAYGKAHMIVDVMEKQAA